MGIDGRDDEVDVTYSTAGSPVMPSTTPREVGPPAPPPHSRSSSTRSFTGAARPLRRGVDASTVGTIVMGVPWFVYSAAVLLVIIGGPLAAISNVEAVPIVVMALWLASGALAFHRPTEAFVARRMFRLRMPTAHERSRLEPAWAIVTRAAGVDGRAYHLWVEESDAPNASASMGHNVSATTAALTHLPGRQLTAVLAHELGHHVGGHAWSGLLMWWYSLPARIFTRAVVVVAGGVLRALISLFPVVGMFAAGLLIVGTVSAAFALIANPVVSALMVVAVVSPVVVPWLARRSELRADRVAIDLGFGPELVESFDEIVALKLDAPRTTLRSRMFASHPSMDLRIRKARNYMTRVR